MDTLTSGLPKFARSTGWDIYAEFGLHARSRLEGDDTNSETTDQFEF
jgi:hypothetical protein